MDARTGSLLLWGVRLGDLLDEMERDGVTIECSDEVRLKRDGESRSIIMDSEATW